MRRQPLRWRSLLPPSLLEGRSRKPFARHAKRHRQSPRYTPRHSRAARHTPMTPPLATARMVEITARRGACCRHSLKGLRAELYMPHAISGRTAATNGQTAMPPARRSMPVSSYGVRTVFRAHRLKLVTVARTAFHYYFMTLIRPLNIAARNYTRSAAAAR